jgi:hypothetical protein
MTKTFKEFLAEDDAAPTNVTGPAIADKDTPLTTKPLKRDPPEGQEGDDDTPEVSVDEVDAPNPDSETPSFQVGSWANRVQFTVPDEQYQALKYGRPKYSRWSNFVAQNDFQAAVAKVLYRDGQAMITSAGSGASIFLTHKINARQLDDMLSMSEDFNPDESVPMDVPDTDSNDEYYDPSYDYATDELGYSDSDADVFGNVVVLFFVMLDQSVDNVSLDDVLQNSIDTTNQVSDQLGLNKTTDAMVSDIKDYLAANFDFGDDSDDAVGPNGTTPQDTSDQVLGGT